jgi:hypothetical protein
MASVECHGLLRHCNARSQSRYDCCYNFCFLHVSEPQSSTLQRSDLALWFYNDPWSRPLT